MDAFILVVFVSVATFANILFLISRFTAFIQEFEFVYLMEFLVDIGLVIALSSLFGMSTHGIIIASFTSLMVSLSLPYMLGVK